MTHDYLTSLLEPIVDEPYLQMAGQIDEHLRQIWKEKAPPMWESIMDSFEAKRGDNAEAEFILLITLTKAMLGEK